MSAPSPEDAHLERGVVESVNVGSPRTIKWQGRTITTSIWKSPVSGRVAVRGINIEGDDQSNRKVHGGVNQAVYAYSREDFDWWSAELGRELVPGTFGENLTIAGVSASAARVGERWRIGSTVLEATQPRLPCDKLAARMGDSHFVKRFSTALRPGVYMRIVQEGELAAGDAVEVLHRPGHDVTMRDIMSIYLWNHEEAYRLLDIPGLPESWREWARERSSVEERLDMSSQE